MGKSRSGASSRPRSVSPPPARAAAPAPKPVSHAPAPVAARPPAAAPAPASAPVSSGGPSLMGTMASSAAGGIAGSVVGHSIANMMFGGRGHGGEAAPAAEPISNQEAAAGPCKDQFKGFMDCLNSNNNQISECQWQFDTYSSCKKSADNGQTYY
eukprot:TRINITY_DN12525_c0_g1_i1.p2 TRINITY_DN12525_c0_g1~~TRINITY_DN12525_c0_g1_i1.p2  ORF type:complete len:155 (-),score=73.43 TRINITY_DN12525_c0_g1_i1:652-1116(-)